MSELVGEGIQFVGDTIAVVVGPIRWIIGEPIALGPVWIVAVAVTISVLPLGPIGWEFIDEHRTFRGVIAPTITVTVRVLARIQREGIPLVGPTITVRIGATEDIVQAGPRGHRASIPLGAVHVVAESIAIRVQPLGPIEWEGIDATRRLHETTRPCLGTVVGPGSVGEVVPPAIPVGVVPLRGIGCEGVLMITPAIQIGIRATQITQ